MLKLTTNLIAVLLFSNISYSNSLMWIEQTSGTAQTLTSVHSVSSQSVWVCGYGGTVLRSTNRGINWINVSGNGIPSNVQLINIVTTFTGDVALTAGYIGVNTFVYRTSNSGASWTQVFTQSNGFINALHYNNFFTAADGFMMGDPVGGRWSIWKTTNGGLNWDSSGLYLPQIGAEAGWVNSLFSIDNKIWFGTNNSRVYYSSNYGSNWSVQPTTGEVNSYCIWFCTLGSSNSFTGFIGGAELQKTTNSGASWLFQNSTGLGNFGGITGGPNIISDNASGYLFRFYVRSDNKIYLSENNGDVWSVDYTAPNGNYRYIAADFPGINVWAVRDNGGISYLDLPVGIEQTSSEVLVSYSLEQNYPNPFNPVTNINYQLPSSEKVSLKIFDMNGREIETLVDDFQAAGYYNVNFHSKNISSGVYFYKLTTNDFSDTKRMILLK